MTSHRSDHVRYKRTTVHAPGLPVFEYNFYIDWNDPELVALAADLENKVFELYMRSRNRDRAIDREKA